MGLTNQMFSTALLFATAIVCVIGFILHLVFFWNPYDGNFLFHRIVVCSTALLCALSGFCIYKNFSTSQTNRFETRFMFLFLFIILIVLLLTSLILFANLWGAEIYTEGLEMTELLNGSESVILSVIFVMAGIATVLLLVIVIVNCWIMSRDWGSLDDDQ